MTQKKLDPIHPGEILREEFLKAMGISQYRLARDINVPARRINEIVHEKRSITADTALRLARFFGVSEAFWLNLQTHYDVEVTRDRIGSQIARDVVVFKSERALVPHHAGEKVSTSGPRLRTSAKAASLRLAKRR